MDQLLKAFSAEIGSSGLSEVDEAVALLWFIADDGEMTAHDLAHAARTCALRGTINVSRLSQNLARHFDVVRGHRPGTFRLKVASRNKYRARYNQFRTAVSIPVTDTVIPNSISLGGRGHLEAMRREINGAYEYGFYNSCAVMCRRLLETLLIDAIDRAGNLQMIVDGQGHLMALSDIIAKVKGARIVRLSRPTPNLLDRAKQTGDQAAHSRYYTASKQDIDDLNPALRSVVTELASLAGIV